MATANMLYPRGLFARHSHSNSNFTCERPKPNEHGKDLSIGISFKTLMIYICAACLGISTLSSIFLIWKHLHRYTHPKEQRQNVRIIFLPVVFCTVSLLSVLSYSASIYLQPLTDVYEAFCIVAVFLLYIEYVCPEVKARPHFFANLPSNNKKKPLAPGGGLKWYNSFYVQVFQLPLTQTLTCVAEIISQAAKIYCANSLSPKYAHIWITIINAFIVGAAVTSVVRFYSWTHKEMDPKHHPLAKLLSFKGIVFFQFVQQILFAFLDDKTLKPSPTMTYDDIFYGLPNTCTAIEATIFSLLFHFSFRSRAYHEAYLPHNDQHTRMSTFHAIFDALNLSDIVMGIFTAFGLLRSKSETSQAYDNVNDGGHDAPKRYNAPSGRRAKQRDSEGDASALEPLRTRVDGYPPVSEPQPAAYYPQHQPPYSTPTIQIQYGQEPLRQQGLTMQQQQSAYEGYGYAAGGGAGGYESREQSPNRSSVVKPRDFA